MTDSSDVEVTREVDIANPREQDHVVELDTRGRITIPASVRRRYGIEADDGDWWVEVTIHKLEKREPSDGQDAGGDA